MTAALQAPGVALGSQELIALRRVMLQATAGPVLANLPGGFSTRRKGHGLEVADIREYVPGDDIRHLDRNATARTGRMHIRQFQQERDRINLLVADFRPSMFWGLRRALRSVAAAEALALIGWSIVESGGRVGLFAITPDKPVIVPPRGRQRGMLDVIGGLVQAHASALQAVPAGQGEDAPLDQALSRVERLVPSGSELVIASGFDAPGAALEDRLASLARRRTPRLVLISDEAVRNIPRGRYPVRLADGRRARLTLGSDSASQNPGEEEIAGLPALVLDAGESIEQTAQRIASAFPAGQH
ncbi:DUF58 domain-containing protein [uncultured Roseobacter sp.]|uniref:DUF58 domain-containing protein n=1 Tax=uncultured Roseobacter sp. TaxID=114847 RepID=UPI002626D686|nr:DUF58 domain-containing protein [uncultured Roseobacter sp.]